MEGENEEQRRHLQRYSQESIPLLKRNIAICNSSTARDWLTFTSPVERRKRGGGEQDGQARKDGCVWVGRRADAAQWKPCWGLQADSLADCLGTNQTWGRSSEAVSGSTDIKLPAQRRPSWFVYYFQLRLDFKIVVSQKMLFFSLPEQHINKQLNRKIILKYLKYGYKIQFLYWFGTIFKLSYIW